MLNQSTKLWYAKKILVVLEYKKAPQTTKMSSNNPWSKVQALFLDNLQI